MKTLVLSLTILCSCFVLASGIEAQEQQEQMSFTPSAYGASASASTDVFEMPASIQISPGTKALIEECLGEPVTIAGNAVLVVHQTILPDGYPVLMVHRNPQNAVLSGVFSGETYHVGGTDTLAVISAPSGLFVDTFTANIHVVGSGGSPGFVGHILTHLSVSPNGDVAANIEIVDIECV
jgi:hypothetical protein